jgi:6-phosphofructokinase 1
MHIPKTIDNDLLVTDHCPGYGSAGKFVSQAFMGINQDNAALPGVYIGVVMGRDAGFLTASSTFARRFPGDGPHLIYVPETPFDMQRFLSDVETCYGEHGRCIIAISEGVRDASGTLMATKFQQQVEQDAHGNIQLSGNAVLADTLSDTIRKELKIKRVRADTLGYLQRSYPTIASEVDVMEAREVGERAVQYAVWGETPGSVAIVRTGDYSVDFALTDLRNVAANTRSMPPEFLKDHNDVSGAFHQYARPLMGSLPRFDRITAPPAKKLLIK